MRGMPRGSAVVIIALLGMVIVAAVFLNSFAPGAVNPATHREATRRAATHRL